MTRTCAPRSIGSRSARGFSLLELLVAFAIMALSLGLLYRSLGGSARQSGELVMQEKATLLARSVLALRESVTAQGWNESGESAGLNWSVTSQPYPTGIAGSQVVPLHRIEVTVSWPDGGRRRQIRLETLLPQRSLLPGEAL